MRAADSDREAIAELLRVAVNEGRLDLYEYDERLRQVYTAKTYAELDGLVTDLPGPVAAGLAQLVPAAGGVPTPSDPVQSNGVGLAASELLRPGPDGRYPRATRRWLAETWNGYGVAVGASVAVWAIIAISAQELTYFWPIWVAGPWGAVLVFATVGGLVRGEPQRWAAKQARRKLAKLTQRGELEGEPG